MDINEAKIYLSHDYIDQLCTKKGCSKQLVYKILNGSVVNSKYKKDVLAYAQVIKEKSLRDAENEILSSNINHNASNRTSKKRSE